MFRSIFQNGFISVFGGGGEDDVLQLWTVAGRTALREDEAGVCDLVVGETASARPLLFAAPTDGSEYARTSASCPPVYFLQGLGIRLPHLCLLLRPGAVFSFAVEVQDASATRRWIRFSTFQPTAEVSRQGTMCLLPLNLSVVVVDMRNGESNASSASSSAGMPASSSTAATLGPWMYVVVDLRELVARHFGGAAYEWTCSVVVHPQCVLRRLFFAERFPKDINDLPLEFRIVQRSA